MEHVILLVVCFCAGMAATTLQVVSEGVEEDWSLSHHVNLGTVIYFTVAEALYWGGSWVIEQVTT
jgi:hypothetical protein